MSKSRRLQVLVEDEQYDRLEREAVDRGVSVATVVREAIDAHLPATTAAKQAALDALLAMPPLDLPTDPADLDDELDDALDGLEV